nr:AraC family transcriptional regulator [Endozoicomonas sp. OPT23]
MITGPTDLARAAGFDIWKPYWVTFLPDPRFVDLLNWPEIGPGVHYLYCDDESEAGQLENSFKELARLSRQHDQHTVRLRYNLTEQLLLRCYQLLPESQRVIVESRVQKAMDYIDLHLTDDVSIKAIADEACVSESTLSRLFRNQTGLTVLGWWVIATRFIFPAVFASRWGVLRAIFEISMCAPDYSLVA